MNIKSQSQSFGFRQAEDKPWCLIRSCVNLHPYFAVVVEVGIEANAVSTCGLQIDERRRVGVVLGEVHVELKAAVGIRSVGWACDQNLEARDGRASENIVPDRGTGFLQPIYNSVLIF